MRSLAKRQAIYYPSAGDSQLGKTWFGRVLHDVGATVVKAAVQPFKSFSNVEKYDKIFNPKLQTKAFSTLNKGIDVLDSVGHAAGKMVTSAYTAGLSDMLIKKAQAKTQTQQAQEVQQAQAMASGSPSASASASANDLLKKQELINEFGRTKTIRQLY